MKQPKKLTLAQKKLLSKRGYNPMKFSFVSEDETQYVFWDKEKEKTQIIEKIRRY